MVMNAHVHVGPRSSQPPILGQTERVVKPNKELQAPENTEPMIQSLYPQQHRGHLQPQRHGLMQRPQLHENVPPPLQHQKLVEPHGEQPRIA